MANFRPPPLMLYHLVTLAWTTPLGTSVTWTFLIFQKNEIFIAFSVEKIEFFFTKQIIVQGQIASKNLVKTLPSPCGFLMTLSRTPPFPRLLHII